MNSKISKTSGSHSLLLNLSDKIIMKTSNKHVVLSNISIYYPWGNKKKSYKNRKFKISASIWNDKFELPNGSYSISDIQDHFYNIIKKQAVTDNSTIRINVTKIENRITSKTKTGYYLDCLTPETMKLLIGTKNKITKDNKWQKCASFRN